MDLLSKLGLAGDLANFGMDAAGGMYDIWRQGEQWKREDTAVQRRVADLKAAGLSPVLAAGSAASSQAIPVRQSPDLKFDNAARAMEVRQRQANIAQTEAQTRLLKIKGDAEETEIWDMLRNNEGTGFNLVPQGPAWKYRMQKMMDILEGESDRQQSKTMSQFWIQLLREKENKLKQMDIDYYRTNKMFQYGGDIFSGVMSIGNLIKGFLGLGKRRR